MSKDLCSCDGKEPSLHSIEKEFFKKAKFDNIYYNGQISEIRIYDSNGSTIYYSNNGTTIRYNWR